MDEEIKTPKSKGGSTTKLIIIIIILLAIAFGGWYGIKKADAPTDTNTVLNGDPTDVIATVNGGEILRAEFDKLLNVQKAVIGEPQDDEQRLALQNQVLDIIISQTLLLQKANEAGLSITDDEVDAQITQVKAQFPDEDTFLAALTEQDFTQESLAQSIKKDLLIQGYITSQVDLESVEVSEEEIKADYDLAITKQDNLPDLETLSGPIKAQLLQQKQQQLVIGLIDKLKGESDIQTFLE